MHVPEPAHFTATHLHSPASSRHTMMGMGGKGKAAMIMERISRRPSLCCCCCCKFTLSALPTTSARGFGAPSAANVSLVHASVTGSPCCWTLDVAFTAELDELVPSDCTSLLLLLPWHPELSSQLRPLSREGCVYPGSNPSFSSTGSIPVAICLLASASSRRARCAVPVFSATLPLHFFRSE